MRALVAALAFALAAPVLAGCVTPDPVGTPPGGVGSGESLSWEAPRILDPVRSGGEPVIFITPQGTILVAVHPGYTHVYGVPGPELITPTTGQSYLFRSTDGGDTWSVISGVAGPRNSATGLSDPDLASNEDGGLLVMVDLQVLVGVSTAASRDDGVSWPDAQPFAITPGDNGVDRPWLAYANGTFYLLYNGDNEGHWRLRASENGVDWRDHSAIGDGSYPGAMTVDPRDGTIYIGNGDKVWTSTDAGVTFTAHDVPATDPHLGITAQRPAVDDAGTLYFAWSEFDTIYYAASHDKGNTWSEAFSLTASDASGTHIWPWPVAGAAGRLAVAWVGTEDVETRDPGSVDATWTVHVAYVDGADSDTPRISTAANPDAIVTEGGICINGTICEAQQQDRRLGDFLTIAADAEGRMHIAYGTTTTGHSISSPAYLRQDAGPRLR